MNSERWYKDLDISITGQPTGIDELPAKTDMGICYCIITVNSVVERVDVYENGQRIHYKQFGYDGQGRVSTNSMYSLDGKGNWILEDDVWHYVYDEETGVRTKKIIVTSGSSRAKEFSYDTEGNRIKEEMVSVTRHGQDS